MATFNNDIPTKFPKLEPKGPAGDIVLAAERGKATFNTQELTKFMYGEEWLERFSRVLEVIENEPTFDKSKRYYQGRDERIDDAFKKDKRMVEIAIENKWTDVDSQIANFLYDQSSPFSLHSGMFLPTLKNQTTDEQKKLFLEPALKRQIIGCYAQTELGHGSNVQGLETTATYINETNEFELHSPTLTSSKWWIGGLGKAANHAIVMARLIVNGKDFGPHPFCVQIRSLEDHRPLKGITVGDIGPKFGFNTVDNGFIMFDHYRIPHISFLARYAQVKPGTGEYIRPPNAKLSYGTMVFVRANIVMGVRFALAKAATIAIRYSAIRNQFVDAANPRKWENKVVETAVLDYTMQQYRMLPIIAQAYACFFTGREMLRLYNENQTNMNAGNFTLLADLHASSSGLKSLCTTMAVQGIEDCRRACGGHGYSMFSGLGSFYQDYLPNVTWEGDNYVLTQQTARYLAKQFRSVAANKTKESDMNFTSAYLYDYLQNPNSKCPAAEAADFMNPEVLLNAFRFRAASMVQKLVHQLDNQGKSWNSMTVEIARVSKAHTQLVLLSNFVTGLQAARSELSSSTMQALRNMAMLFGSHTLEQELADFLVSQYLTPDQAGMVKDLTLDLLTKVRPDAVALVDAFALPDYYLHSALGRYDGKVYESMTQMAEAEPLNHKLVTDSYEECIKPLVHAGKAEGRWKGDGMQAKL
ncbi:acyl-CoA dehydrogenase/oxidase C-terminal [Umbelopsis sp. PMI_123]|nr:acyl-CoA dehydrogenase/oxidase C-terminal [Umbelopsis sp. PMI_123]